MYIRHKNYSRSIVFQYVKFCNDGSSFFPLQLYYVSFALKFILKLLDNILFLIFFEQQFFLFLHNIFVLQLCCYKLTRIHSIFLTVKKAYPTLYLREISTHTLSLFFIAHLLFITSCSPDYTNSINIMEKLIIN